MTKRAVATVGLALLLVLARDSDGGAAPAVGWRGNAAGLHPRAHPPREWGADKNVRWKADVGKGISSPVAVGEKVVLTAEPDVLICLDAASGKVLWRRTHGAKDLPAADRGKDLEPPTECGYATPTPCGDAKRVYALFGNGVVACCDLDGNRRWIRLIDIRQTETHGRSASPLLVGGRLIVHVSDLFCLDAATGRTLWRRPAKAALGTPAAVRIGEADLVVTPQGDVFRLADGKRLATGMAGLDVASPVVHEGVVYFVAATATAWKLPREIVDGQPFAVAQLWKVRLPGQCFASPLIHNGLIYTIGKTGHLFALDAKSGATVFSRKLTVKSDCAPSPALAGEHLFLPTDGGVTLVLKPGRGYREVCRNTLTPGSMSTPAFSGGRIFLRSGEALVCIQAGAGPPPASRASPPAAKSGPDRPGRPASPQPAGSLLMGWRGNGTGLFPRATPVLKWGRRSQGIVAGMRISSARPKGAGAGGAKPIRNHFPREWLLVGPLPAPKGLDSPAPANEETLRPDEGDRVGELVWKKHAMPEDVTPPSERGTVAGTVSLRFVQPDKVLGGFKPNHLVYAHTYLYSPRDGEVELLVDHAVGLAVRVNGKQVYGEPSTVVRLSWYTVLGRFRTGQYTVEPSPRIRVSLTKGWNRLLLKLCHGRKNWDRYDFNPRLVDLPTAPHEQENILWAAPLPDRSNATPVIVKDRIFVMAEPDEILCLDKQTGRHLWSRFLGRFQATPKAQRDANPAFKRKVEPLVAKLPGAKGLKARMDLRKKIDAALVAIDAGKYKLKWDGHMSSHFRIVGWTQPTPCSDGRYVYVYCGNGVAACYDLQGNTRWIRRVNPGELHYPASPALVAGKFVVFAGGGFNMVALDAETGKVAWRQPKVDKSVGALIGARINGVAVVISQQGDVVRAADGKRLYSNPLKRTGDTGWAPPMCLDGVIYLPWSGVGNLLVKDFRSASGDAWTCQRRDVGDIAVNRDSKGGWIDRWTCGSPLVHEGIYYNQDVFGTLYAVDLKTRKVLYRRDLSADFNMLTHYNALGVAASITLGGKHLFAMDNQGTTVVFQPGRAFKKVAVNRIERQVYRPWPMRPQEEIGYSPPLFEGPRMYLRGERYLYCVGRQAGRSCPEAHQIPPKMRPALADNTSAPPRHWALAARRRPREHEQTQMRTIPGLTWHGLGRILQDSESSLAAARDGRIPR